MAGFNLQTQYHMSVEFVGSLLCTERFFSRYSAFLSSKTKTLIILIYINSLISVYSVLNSAPVLEDSTLQ